MVRVNVVVAVVLPLVPLMVIVKVPAAALLDTLTPMAAVPEPPVMDVGLKVIVTPLGCPEADRAIVPVKPPEGVAVILTLPCPPGAMLPFVGFAARVKLPPPELVTVSETVVVSVVLPEVPFTVMVYVPVAVLAATAIVMVEVPVPVIEVGLKVTVTPVG